MSIRKMTESDIPAVIALQNELAFQEWNEKQVLSEVKASYAHCVVYDNGDGTISGYAIFHILGPDTELLSIAVRKDQGRKGLGKSLLKSGTDLLDFSAGDQCFLEVREGNSSARNFYEKNGFNIIGSRSHYYSDGENAILYVLK